MLLRKSRKHLQGASNRPNFQGTFYGTAFHQSTILKKEMTVHHAVPSTSSHKARKQYKNRMSYTQPHIQQDSSPSSQGIQKLRNMYRGRKNIVKVLDAWGFSECGYISREIFEEKIKQRVGEYYKKEEIQAYGAKHFQNKSIIRSDQLINLLYKGEDNPFLFQRIFSPQQTSANRQKKIVDLKQDLKHYGQRVSDFNFVDIDNFLHKINSSISKIKDKQGYIPNNKQEFFQKIVKYSSYGPKQRQLLEQLQAVSNFSAIRDLVAANKNADSKFIDPLIRKVRKEGNFFSEKQNQQRNDEKYSSMLKDLSKFSSTSSKFLSRKQKSYEFDPAQMANVNQQKTRFGKSIFLKEQGDFPIGQKQCVSPNQKQLILQSIRSEQNLQKIRKINRIHKLQMLRQVEKENIARKEEQAENRDACRMQRIRHEQQAYNYVNFIKNKWQ